MLGGGCGSVVYDSLLGGEGKELAAWIHRPAKPFTMRKVNVEHEVQSPYCHAAWQKRDLSSSTPMYVALLIS